MSQTLDSSAYVVRRGKLYTVMAKLITNRVDAREPKIMREAGSLLFF